MEFYHNSEKHKIICGERNIAPNCRKLKSESTEKSKRNSYDYFGESTIS